MLALLHALGYFGRLLFAIGLLMLVITFFPVLVQEAKFRFNPTPRTELLDTPQKVEEALTADPEFRRTTIVPKSFDFSLVIPRLGINTLITPHVDSADPDAYLPILKNGAAHALYSSLPNQRGPVFIFGHSTDTFYNITHYNAIFFLLRKLDPGDDVYIFYEKKKYHFQVDHQEILDPLVVPSRVASIQDDLLILQTCYPPGTTLKRLLVFAKKA